MQKSYSPVIVYRYVPIIMGTICHKLDPQRPEIRLLHLLPSNELDSPPQCLIVHKFLSDQPEYECLSYVWGKPDFTISIELDGQQHFITENSSGVETSTRTSRISG